MTEIRAATVLPAKRTPVTLYTSDGLRLAGELAVPADADPVATLICLHPLPTHGGVLRAPRLLAGLQCLEGRPRLPGSGVGKPRAARAGDCSAD